MIYRKQAKTITENEFKSKRKDLIFNLEYILCKDYVYILDSMDMEDYDYDDTSIDIFQELVWDNKVVGYVSYFESRGKLELMEAYVMPEYRNNNLLYDEISSKDNLVIHQPKINLVKALTTSDIACELSDGIVVSKIPFSISGFELNRKYDDKISNIYSHVYDLKNGSVLILESPENFNYSMPTRTDLKKYKLKNDISDERLKKAYEIISDYDEKYLKVTQKTWAPTIVFV